MCVAAARRGKDKGLVACKLNKNIVGEVKMALSCNSISTEHVHTFAIGVEPPTLQVAARAVLHSGKQRWFGCNTLRSY
eukprot:SAG31_NODE_2477_length_5637_cov_10.057241_7_plen_78_part_00